MINDGVLEHLLLQVNLPYIFWVVAFNTWFLLAYFILDTVFYPTLGHSKTRKLSSTRDTGAEESISNFQRNSHDGQAKATPAPLLDAINKNGLALFLLVSADSSFISCALCWNKTRQTYARVSSTCLFAQSTHPIRLLW